MNTILAYFPTSQHNQYNIMMVSICTYEYCIRSSAMLGLGQCVILFYRTLAEIVIRQYIVSPSSLSRTPSFSFFACHSVHCICYYCYYYLAVFGGNTDIYRLCVCLAPVLTLTDSFRSCWDTYRLCVCLAPVLTLTDSFRSCWDTYRLCVCLAPILTLTDSFRSCWDTYRLYVSSTRTYTY